MLKGRDWSWLGFLRVIPLCFALATGSFSIARDALFLSGKMPDPHTAFWLWLRVCFVVSAAWAWYQQHEGLTKLERRLQPRIVIGDLRSRTWKRENGASGIEYWLDIFNPSDGNSLELVRAEMTRIAPDLFGYLPLPLHVKHDQSYEARHFSVNPGATGMVDIITGPSGHHGSQQVMIIPHTVGGGWLSMPIADYTFTIKVSAQNVPPIESTFTAWVGDDGKLKCEPLGSARS
jgi:hypothetical protein